MEIFITDPLTGERRPARTFEEVLSVAPKTPLNKGGNPFSTANLQAAANKINSEYEAEQNKIEMERRARKIKEAELKKLEEKRRLEELKRILPHIFGR